ncbi:MAG: succinate dehydrogenase [Deltaproteobacteria bacterium]|nr:MAG: succinate dehydrogenase [Deltaproteobacteria bacterium]
MFDFLGSTIGKKMLMAASGLCLILFLCVHAAGNITIFVGSELFQGYADNLHSHPVIVFCFRVGLTAIFAIHIMLGLKLWLAGRKEGKNRYIVNKWASRNSLAMSTMPYTGILLLVFVLVHVFDFAVAPGHDDKISQVVAEVLGNYGMVIFYLLGFTALFIHLSHGFWSMLQTFGLNHPRYNAAITCATYLVPGFFLCFFSVLALYLLTAGSY